MNLIAAASSDEPLAALTKGTCFLQFGRLVRTENRSHGAIEDRVEAVDRVFVGLDIVRRRGEAVEVQDLLAQERRSARPRI